MIAEIVQRIIAEWSAEEGWDDVPSCRLDRPADEDHGDYATPLCLQLAKAARKSPRILAEELRVRLLADSSLAALVEKIDVAGPGFLNFTLSGRAYSQVMSAMLADGDAFGRGASKPHPRVNLEFVSVNPNGPLHVGHGRYAAYGDSLHRLLSFSGMNVSTEFYVNDYGRQMDRFGRSIAARYAQSFGVDLAVPMDGYQGDYVLNVAHTLRDEVGDKWEGILREVATLATGPAEDRSTEQTGSMAEGADFGEADEMESETESDWPDVAGLPETIAFFRARGCALMLAQMRSELSTFGVEFDCWFSETTLHESGRLMFLVEHLLKTGEAYRQTDAIWLRTTSRGDDKDRVLVRSNTHPTYFAADIAYHDNKLERGFEHLINIWGADHHGYVPRMKAAVEILSGRPDTLEVIIGQLVNLLEQGEARQMSTRRGEMVTLAELVEAVGVDAARFFLIMRSHDQTLDLDIALARRQSQDNPVYYVQYAHARIASIIRNVSGTFSPAVSDEETVFASPYERSLIKRLDSFPFLVQEAADRRAPHRVAGFAQELAADFHVFYKHCRVLGVEERLATSRLALCMVTKGVIASCLALLGVSAPESM